MASRALRITGIVLGSLVLLILVAFGIVYLVSNGKLNKAYAVTPPPLLITADSAALAHGKYLAEVRLGCTGCHGSDLGGQVVVDAMPFGRFVATNLTSGRGGIGSSWTATDYIRAIRHGVRPDSTPVVFMPSHVFAELGAEDLAAVVTYVRSVPPVDRELPASALGPIARMIVATGDSPLIPATLIDHAAAFPGIPAAGPNPEYGRYLVTTGGCYDCHGPNLAGGKIAGGPEAPPAANITPAGIGSWTQADFIRSFREGKRPDGSAIDEFMPWQTMGQMSDVELIAMYEYLKTVPAVEKQ